MRLRNWQADCSEQAVAYFKNGHSNFFLVSPPGTGKSVTVAEIAARLYAEGLADLILCIFRQYDDWYDAAADARKRWQIPIHVSMAMMFQESSFKEDAQPRMEYILGFIPIGRASSAYGYAQAKDETWRQYANETGHSLASRDDFADAMDFIGWFAHKSNKLNKVSKSDAYGLYLNYHEGWGGYRNGSYQKKAWLKNVARKVQQRAARYQKQLQSCEKEFQSSWFNWF